MNDVRLLVGVLALLCLQTGIAQAEVSDSHAVIGQSLRKNLVGHGKLDGAPVTNVVQQGSCVTTFSTASETVTVDWTKVVNFADQGAEGGGTVIPLQHDYTTSDLLVPAPIAARVSSSVGMLFGDCQPQ